MHNLAYKVVLLEIENNKHLCFLRAHLQMCPILDMEKQQKTPLRLL